MGKLDGKTILITGASSGFGAATAIACAKEGANVSLAARRQPELESVAQQCREIGVKALVCPCDVTDDAQIHAAVGATREAFGGIYALFNNAGANMRARSVTDTTPEDWRWIMEVNLTSAFVFTRAVLPDMMAQGGGIIINLASQAGVRPSLLAGVSYSASKIGMDALTRVTNEEGNPHGVRACIFNPGLGNTPIIENRGTPFSDAERENMIQSEDIADTVVFLCSLHPRVNINEISMLPTRK